MTSRVVIALTLFISMLLMGVLGSTVNAVSLQRMETQRLQSVTARLRTALETDLHVGIALADNERAQVMLENAVADTSMLASVEIDSEDGRVLFSSDRVLRNELIPPSWRQAMHATPAGWQVVSGGELSLAAALRDATGEIAGYLVLTHQTEHDEDEVMLPAPVVWAATLVGLLTLLVGWLTERRARALDPAADGVVSDVMHVIEEARGDIARVNDEAHRIAGLGS
ncbi:cache domain-containing protein [Peristeroidobacter soli]|uniref:cache domain-containing protein n=1 Tax=Peristeroidobacter soli TaxID=2497877 RepID=UPI00101B628C|nr:cache domain-containing protein [Peristeroidobacter soli]